MKRAIALLVALAMSGCGGRSPAQAVRELSEAARDGDAERVLALLGPRTRARLEADARRAGEQAGHRRVAAVDLIAAGWTAPRWEPERVAEIERRGERGTVEVKGERGEREVVEVVKVGGEWRVELP